MKKLVICLILLGLNGCGSIVTPERHYYRLGEVKINDISLDRINKIKLSVADFKVVGLLNNRNLVYVNNDKPQEILQFNYHYWHESLSNILTRNFTKSLKESFSDAKISSFKYTIKNGYVVHARVDVMEVLYKKGVAIPVIKITFKLKDAEGVVLLEKTYKNTKELTNKDIYYIVTQYSYLLENIYKLFLIDVVKLKLDV